MKVTKRQLRQIIKEERRRLLREQAAPPDQEIIAAVEAAMFTMEEAAEELEAQHAMTMDRDGGYEPAAPEIVAKLREDAHELETLVLAFLGRLG